MTHLSDFSYVQRCCLEVYITAYLIHNIWRHDRFQCLRPSKLAAGELKSIITYLMFLMMVLQASWDIISTWIKYREGFMPLPNGDIISKPFAFWDEYHQNFIQPIDYVQCISFALQTGVFFLLQCFWHYLSNSVARRSFMGSWEFRFYIVWAICSMAMFPILQWRFNEDQYKSEAVPQLAYGLEVLITAVLGVRSHFRFTRILNATRERKIVHRLEYFRDMNVMLTIILFIYGACLVILCVDGLTEEKPINSHKFGTDLLIVNCNICIIFLWIAFISIFHPRRTYTKDATSHLGTDEEEMVSRNGRVTKFVMQNATKRYNDNGQEPNGTASDYRMPSYYVNPESNPPQNNIHDPMPDHHYHA